MAEVCDLIPESYKEECSDFVDKYGVQIVEFLLSSAAPHTICSLLHLCLFNEKPVPGQFIISAFLHNWCQSHSLSLTKLTLISQRCSSLRSASHAAYWLCWADCTWVSIPLNLRLPLFCSLCVSVILMPSLRSVFCLLYYYYNHHNNKIHNTFLNSLSWSHPPHFVNTLCMYVPTCSVVGLSLFIT